MKKKILDFAKRYHFIMKLIRKVKFLLDRTIYLFYFVTNKIDNNLIIFESYMGKNYSCNPKYIYEELKNNKSFNFVWAFTNEKEYKYLENQNTKIIKYNSKEYRKKYAQAKYIISNSRIPNYILKKKKQIYIQTWHGTPLKKLGFDISVKGGNVMNTKRDIKNKYNEDSKKYNYLISSSNYCTEKFISAFNIKNENIILETGFPRCDYLINYNKNEIPKIKEKLNIPKNKKIILYAPTWRDNQHTSALGYTYKLNINFDKLQKELTDYIILFRTHYFIKNKIDLKKYKNFVFDVSEYKDINDLYIISDLLITDYSSVFFDYAILNKPIIFYMYDYNEYKNKIRDFYIEIKELPGPITKNENELLNEINEINTYNKKYQKKYQNFNKKFNYLHKGNASKRIIEECIKGSETNEKIRRQCNNTSL